MRSVNLFLLIFFAMTACSGPHHVILGSESGHGWAGKKTEIILDAKIDKLKVRHVRMRAPRCASGHTDHIEIAGLIGPDSTASLERLLPKLDDCILANGAKEVNNVYLSSGGGLLSDGSELGRLFRKYKVTTVITGGQKCASSCAVAFLGGKYRTMAFDAELLFHAPYLNKGVAIDCSDRGQVAGLLKYYKQMLGDKEGSYLLERTMGYCSATEGWTLNSGGAKLFDIVTD
jgi:hypothetical protein